MMHGADVLARSRPLYVFGGTNSPAIVHGHVTPILPAPFLLLSATLHINAFSATPAGWNLWISDDNDLTNLTNLTGNRVMNGVFNTIAGDQTDLVYSPTQGTWRVEPHYLRARSPGFIKAKVHIGNAANQYVLAIEVALL